MGFLTALVTLPLAPLKATMWVAEQVSEQAMRELYDEGRIRQELEELERLHDAGQISDDEYESNEEVLLDRLLNPPEGVR
jgi:Gas vesicle protein G